MRLNSFKHKLCGVTEENGKATIGKGYWSDFMKRNGNRLNILRPHQFGLDRTNWCKYISFYDMYDSVKMALIKESVMTMLEDPEWQDKGWSRVELKSDAYG